MQGRRRYYKTIPDINGIISSDHVRVESGHSNHLNYELLQEKERLFCCSVGSVVRTVAARSQVQVLDRAQLLLKPQVAGTGCLNIR
uniref:Uncharacterized protein n=1 Tax=Romanomermis culicivorax TaxID=13658 RepID=A0A915J5U2_ROMCU